MLKCVFRCAPQAYAYQFAYIVVRFSVVRSLFAASVSLFVFICSLRCSRFHFCINIMADYKCARGHELESTTVYTQKLRMHLCIALLLEHICKYVCLACSIDKHINSMCMHPESGVQAWAESPLLTHSQLRPACYSCTYTCLLKIKIKTTITFSGNVRPHTVDAPVQLPALSHLGGGVHRHPQSRTESLVWLNSGEKFF